MEKETNVTRLYQLRFRKELQRRNEIWKVLCTDFFQRYIKADYTVCDLGAGYCEFINNINSKNKIAVDINPDIKKYAQKNVKTFICPSTEISKKILDNIDVVFASNFFEHLPSKDYLVKTLIEIKRILNKGGMLIILMPNIRHVGASYWDFLDHQLPLTDKSMTEALELTGFKIIEQRSRFLPYSTKGKLPKSPFFVSLYLKMPFLHPFFGKQSLIVAQKFAKKIR